MKQSQTSDSLTVSLDAAADWQGQHWYGQQELFTLVHSPGSFIRVPPAARTNHLPACARWSEDKGWIPPSLMLLFESFQQKTPIHQ